MAGDSQQNALLLAAAAAAASLLGWHLHRQKDGARYGELDGQSCLNRTVQVVQLIQLLIGRHEHDVHAAPRSSDWHDSRLSSSGCHRSQFLEGICVSEANATACGHAWSMLNDMFDMVVHCAGVVSFSSRLVAGADGCDLGFRS